MDNKSHYSFGIYKYGQGYWVRMMTAILAGVLFLSAAAWLWGQLTKVDIPTPRWSYTIDQVKGVATPGQTVTLTQLGEPGQLVGTGVVESFNTSGRSANLIVGQLSMDGASRPFEAKQLSIKGADGSNTFTAAVIRPDGLRAFNLVYLQAGVAALVVLLGGWLIYLFVGRKPESVEFLIATDAEMRKVNWGTRKVILDSTYVVIGATFLIAGVIFAADVMFQQIARYIGVLGTK